MTDSGAGRPDEPGVDEHTHHWLIGEQDGPSSQAVCKECGESREFSNSLARRKPPWVTRTRSGSANAPDHPQESVGDD
jgi:hypothetical protein